MSIHCGGVQIPRSSGKPPPINSITIALYVFGIKIQQREDIYYYNFDGVFENSASIKGRKKTDDITAIYQSFYYAHANIKNSPNVYEK